MGNATFNVTPERYSQVKSLFQLVLERPPQERIPFLQVACGADRELYEHVSALVNSDADSGSQEFLERPAVTPMGQMLDEASRQQDDVMPSHIGPYAIHRQIGSGGMGAVYLASRADQQYNRQVAIKVIRRGMEQDRIIARFRRERQIIASLDHPNIARLLDGGATEDGRPYIVMEYVEGKPIDAWCDERKLTVSQRMELFRQVCSAVHYAHQNLVVHRDLKPGNILVKDDGTVKLLDFGIAKLLSPDGSPKPGENTATSMRLMTPQYASPEQMMGEQVTTTSDVYLLGIVLYELLTGHRPFPFKEGATLELMRSMTQTTPEKPSMAVYRVVEALNRDGARQVVKNPLMVASVRSTSPPKLHSELKGDLDAIILHALQRNPAERYQSAAQLSDDLGRMGQAVPISIRQQTPYYLSKLFLRRNKAIAIMAAVALVGILGNGVVAVWEARNARLQKEQADRRFEMARTMANSLLFDVHDAIAPLSGTTAARTLLVKKAQAYLAGLRKEAANDTQLELDLARSYIRVGHLLGNPNYANLGDTAAAASAYRNALQLLQPLAAKLTEPEEALRQNGLALEALADVEFTMGEAQEALKHYQQAQDLFEKAKAPAGDFIPCYHSQATILASLGSTAQALTLSKQAHELALRTPTDKRQLAVSYGRLGAVEMLAGDYNAAATHLSEALRMHETLHNEQPNAIHQRQLAYVLEDLATLQRRRGDFTAAANYASRSLVLRSELASNDPQNVQAQRDVAYSYLKQEGAENAQRALQVFTSLFRLDPNNTIVRRDVALAHQRLGDAHRASSPAMALTHYRQFKEMTRQWLASDTTNSYAQQTLAAAHMKLAETLEATGDSGAALQESAEAMKVMDELTKTEPNNGLLQRDHALARFLYGRTLLIRGRAANTAADIRLGEQALREARVQLQQLVEKGKLPENDRKVVDAINGLLQP